MVDDEAVMSPPQKRLKMELKTEAAESSEDDYDSSSRQSQTSVVSLGSPMHSGTEDNKDDDNKVSFFLSSTGCTALASADLASQPVMPFTAEETSLVHSVLDKNVATTTSIQVDPQTLMTLVRAAQTGSAIPYETLLEGYTTCMKRIIKFASTLDFFQSFDAADQRALLLSNTDMVVNIRSARLLRPGINLQAQLNHVVAGERKSPDRTVDIFRPPERIEYQQVGK